LAEGPDLEADLSLQRKKLERACAVALGVAVTMLAVPRVASAALFTYSPPGGCSSPSTCATGTTGDLNDLDHHYVYAWKITDPSLAGKTVSSASITFNDLYNWYTNVNQLYLNLLNTALNAGASAPGTAYSGLSNSNTVAALNGGSSPVRNATSCVTQFNDDNTADSPVSTVCDAFSPGSGGFSQGCGSQPNLAASEGWLVSSGTGDDFLTSQGFWEQGQNPATDSGGDDPWATVPSLNSCNPGANGCWYYTADGANPGLYNYTFVFGTNDLSDLNGFITTGNDFAIGVDADCHLFNNGIELDLSANSTTGGPGVPEPASLTLLGLGLVAMSRVAVRRRQRQTKS
jgi:hypothetical protein